MIVQEIIKIITIMVASSFKMLFGVPLAIATGYNQLESIIIASAGGIIGVVIFTFFSQWIINVIEKFGSKKEKRIFTKRNRFIIKVRQRFGLIGLAFIAPNLTIPVGTFVLVKYFKSRRKIILYESLSVIFCAVVTSLIMSPTFSLAF